MCDLGVLMEAHQYPPMSLCDVCGSTPDALGQVRSLLGHGSELTAVLTATTAHTRMIAILSDHNGKPPAQGPAGPFSLGMPTRPAQP